VEEAGAELEKRPERKRRAALGRPLPAPRRGASGLPRAFGIAATLAAVWFAGSGAAAADPARVASLLPFVGDALSPIPDRARVVAEARRELRTPPPDGIVDLGNPHSPDLEGLAAAKPAFVVGERALHGRLAPDLARSGAEVVLLDTSGVDATLDGLVDLGARLGGRGPLAERAEALRAELASLRLAEPLPVLALFGTPDSFFVLTERTWLGDLLTRLGFELPPLAAGESARFPGFVPVSDELLVTLRPELVLLVAHGDPAALREALVRKTSDGGPWSALGRSATRGVRVLDPRLFAANPGFGMGRAAQELVRMAAEPKAAQVSAP
jgi:ABC-type Fe3+-hydroxamate transport system substrate-binding protein